MRIECPNCTTSYPIELTGLHEEQDTAFTIVCMVCGIAFDGTITSTPEVAAIEGVAGSLLHSLTFGWLGTPPIEAKEGVPAERLVLTRFRQEII